MVMMHKIKAKKIVQGRFGRKKTVEVDVYAPSTYTHISEMAGYAAGVSEDGAAYATHTHHHYGDYGDEYILLGKKKGYDEFAYDALIGILGGIASWKYGADEINKKYRQTLVENGQKDGEVYYSLRPIKETKRMILLNRLALYSKAIIVQLPDFDDFVEKHLNILKAILIQEILSKTPKRWPKDEEDKIEKTIEIAIDVAKKLAEVYGDPEKLVHVGLMEINHANGALNTLEFLNPEKHPLDVIGDHIIELKKMHPEVVKPEEVYGEEWYEFLKKKGMDPEELNPEKKKSKTTAPSQSLTLVARELLGLLSGLRLAGYSEGALENLRRELEKRIDGLIENPEENLELIGLYTTILKLTERGETEKAERLLKEL